VAQPFPNKVASAARVLGGAEAFSFDPSAAASLEAFHDQLRSRLVELFDNESYQPPLLPATALQVLKLSRNPNSSIDQMVSALEQDPVLAGAVLKLAQSAAISGGAKIGSLNAAITRMGLVRAAALFYRAAVEAKIFRVLGYDTILERLRLHSVMTAEMARLICRERGMDEGLGYLVGLLHDVGIAGALVAIVEGAGRQAPTQFSEVWPAICGIHGQLTHRLVCLWMIPSPVITALDCLHQRECQTVDDPLAMVAVMAEVMASSVGLGFEAEEQAWRIAHAAQQLGYAISDLERLERIAEELRKALATA
jgi:HD-like signal output (HDOD) protein